MNNSSKYFFSKCQELLHRKTFDSYRVSLHNPFTIFFELKKCIEKYNKKRIKNFEPTITSIGVEAKYQLTKEYIDDVFLFGSFTKKQINDILESCCIKNKDGKRNRTLSLVCKTINYENSNFKLELLNKINLLLIENDDNNFERIDTYTSWLLSQLLFEGYSRTYINERIKKTYAVINSGSQIGSSFDFLISQFSKIIDNYEVIFKIKKKSDEPIRITSNLISEIDLFPIEHNENTFVNEKFKSKDENESFFKVKIESLDFWSALSKAYEIISESIEINVLHYSDNKILLETQAFIIHVASQKVRMQPISENIDGFYNYKESEFARFAENFKKLEVGSVAHEKIRSAIRFYKLGNDSIEIEHKMLNYWIGIEQLFSSVDSNENSITRLKTFFISINSVYFWQRKINYLLSSLKRYGVEKSIVDIEITMPDLTDLPNVLIKSRYNSYKNKLSDKAYISSSLEKHVLRMEQHLTRIYRVRNELVHEGRSFLDLFLLAGHLRHYLIFSIEQITNELAESNNLSQIDDVFVYYENLFTRIKQAQSIQEIFSIKNYNGYME